MQSYQGLLRAEADFGVTGTVYTPTTPAEYEVELHQCVTDGNQLCIGVGFLLTDAVLAAAQNNPGTKFLIIDATYDNYPANLRGTYFAMDEPGYLAGVLSARMTGSKKLGVIGGMPIPPVNLFIMGFRQGALCTDPTIQTLIDYTNDFVNPELGAQYARDMINQGADVIFGVAGPTGEGAVITATQSQKWGIGVDTDYFDSVFGSGSVPGAQYLLTSAMKRMDNAVYSSIADLIGGTFTSGTKVYNLANDGVGLAPYHLADASISQATKDEINALKSSIIAGNIDPLAPCPGQMQVGLVSDTGGFNDQSFNMMAAQGLWRAQNELGVFIRTYESASENDYLPNLQQCINDGATLCFGVAFLMGDAVNDAALANPTKKFAILDYTYNSYPLNLRGITFAVDQAGYLAGALAASMAGVDKVGAVGGMQIPPVDLFIDGYRQGAQCTQAGIPVLVSYTNNFVDPQLGAQHARQMLNQGADAIFAVAGPTGYGAVITTTYSHKWAIGVDVDYYYSVFDGGNIPGSEYLLTSVMKHLDNAVFGTVADTKAGNFTSGTKVYDLANQGVGLAPFHDADPAVPGYVRSYLWRLEQDIIAGKINENNPCRYYIYTPLVQK
jgi:basic membrane protein A